MCFLQYLIINSPNNFTFLCNIHPKNTVQFGLNSDSFGRKSPFHYAFFYLFLVSMNVLMSIKTNVLLLYKSSWRALEAFNFKSITKLLISSACLLTMDTACHLAWYVIILNPEYSFLKAML